MNEKIDTTELLNRVNIVGVIGSRLSLSKKGTEYYGICPFHNDHKASLQVNEAKQVYKCFSCGAGGDAIDFLQRGGLSFLEAVDTLNGNQSAWQPSKVQIDKKTEVDFQYIIPVPLSAPEPTNDYKRKKGDKWVAQRFIKRWTYKDASGAILQHKVRFHDTDGSKNIIPQCYGINKKGKEGWAWKGLPIPRPIYGLYELAKNKDKTVLVVEGEKTADAARKLFPRMVCICWDGASEGIHNVDWTPLADKRVIFWPDNDDPGIKAATWFKEHVGKTLKGLKFVNPPSGTVKGWDLADAEWTAEQAQEYTKSNLINDVPKPTYKEEIKQEPQHQVQELLPVPSSNNAEQDGIERPFFRFLGFEKNESGTIYVFFVDSTKTIVKYSAGGLTKSNMFTLVTDPTWWETNFPDKRGFNQDMAATWLMNRNHHVGMFDASRIRGRGAWMDNHRAVMHIGDNLIIDGKRVGLGQIESRFMYEQSKRLEFADTAPAETEKTKKLVDALHLVNWDRPISPILLAGWCVVAPVCGSLFWRPHIWLTGAAGTGKSWIMDNVIRPMLGDMALAVQGDTTEAGLRQTLGMDALPVVFDEADTDDQRDTDRVQKVLALMRSSSTGSGGKIIKGSAQGTSKEFEIRSCFALGSIAVQAAKAADKSRITVLSIKRELDREKSKSQFEQLEKQIFELITPQFVASLQARTVKMLPIILHNAKIFSDALSSVLGFRRTGDQVGTLVAGALSLMSDKKVSYETAKAWILEKDWSEEKGLDDQRDEMQLLTYLMEQLVVVDGNTMKITRSIGELLRAAAGHYTDTDITGLLAGENLKRIGFKINIKEFEFPLTFMICNDHDWIKKRLKDTSWVNGYNKILTRLEGSQTTKAERFASGIVSRAVEIPLSYIS